jgi:hypothetical protein
MWIVQPMQIADKDGNPTGRWRMTARSDEGGGGPFGDLTHDHSTAAEAEQCERCDEFTASCTGFPSKARLQQENEQRDRKEFDRLKAKFEPPAEPWNGDDNDSIAPSGGGKS